MKRRVSVCILLVICVGVPSRLSAQSTYGTILGSVKDSSGAALPHVKVLITNTDENTSRSVETNASGEYTAPNLLPDHYEVSVNAQGFRDFTATGLSLVARQTLRVDAELQVGSSQQTVTVNATEAGVIATDSQAIQATFNPKALLNLPANIRANGNTSPYQLIQVLPGVQADNSGNFSIQGGIPSQTQYSLDGISITNVGGNSPLTNAFPSTESIAEIKVQGVGNQAEYGQVGDITTISKSGTNEFHGDLFWYAQNAALNATHFGDITKPKLVANDYGASAGGPVIIPHLYNGKDRTFFYGTYEGFRYPQQTASQQTVPTEAMRNGNFSAEGVTVRDLAGNPYPNDTIPTADISPIAQKILSLYPLPNYGDTSKVQVNNYRVNRDSSYHDEQYDIRIDHYLTSKQSVYARWTWKDITEKSPQNLLVPSSDGIDNYRLLTAAYNYSILPNLLNEARFGITFNNQGSTNPFDGKAFLASLGLQGLLSPTPFFNGLPDISISNFQGLNADRLDSVSKNQTIQWADNVTWTKGRHTFKFGVDIRHIRAVSPLGFISGDNYGGFQFNGTATSVPFGDFLLGVPTTSDVDNVQMDNDGRSNHYNAFAQDSYHVTDKLTLEYGIRFEFHPGYIDASGNIGNFDPSYPRSGAVIYPDGFSNILAQNYLASANACPTLGSTQGPTVNGAPCMPVLSASQAGLPNSLRTAPKRFMPRFGFAYRPFSDDKTVVRGGFSVFNTEVLGSIYYALTGTLQSATLNYTNTINNGVPLYRWPQIGAGSGGSVSPYGTAYFGTADQINYKDPYSEQWNLSFDRALGFNTGVRISYIGMATRDLVWSPNLNQSYYSNTYYVDQPLTSRPFPNWGTVNTRANGANAFYNSGQIEFNHRYQAGLTFNSTYTFAKNLADNQGYSPTSFPGENSGSRTMDLYDLKHEYGDVYGTRRHRWITSAVYDLPVGRGRAFGGKMNRFADALIGGWQFSSIFLWQSGPYLTPYFSDGDPSGTGSGYQRSQAPDLVGAPNLSNPTTGQWFNLSAFTCPGVPGWTAGHQCLVGTPGAFDPTTGQGIAPLGRFGNAGMSHVLGPATINVNAGLSKYFAVTERVRIKVEGSFTNVLNHVNLSDPNLAIDSASPGLITAARSSDFGGNRTGQVGARVEF